MTLPSTRTLLLSSVTVASLYVVHSRIIASFGSYGRLGMFVWEGDSLTAEERAASDALNEAEKKLKELAKTLGDVEVEMEVAKMDGLDGGEARGIVVSPFNASIVKRLAEVSDLLDKTAAKLDTGKHRCCRSWRVRSWRVARARCYLPLRLPQHPPHQWPRRTTPTGGAGSGSRRTRTGSWLGPTRRSTSCRGRRGSRGTPRIERASRPAANCCLQRFRLITPPALPRSS